MSLARRVLVGFLVVAAVLVVTNVVLAGTFHSFLLDRVDRQLVTAASTAAGRHGRGGGPVRIPPSVTGDNQAFTEYFIAVGDPGSGSLTRLSSALADQDQPPPRLERSEIVAHIAGRAQAPVPFTLPAESGRSAWRLVAIESGFNRQVTVVGISLDELEATLDRTRLVQFGATAAVLGALAVVSWWMLRLGVHPLAAMARTADAIAGGDLSHRVEHPDERTEAGRLGVALNAMLERIEDAFRAREASEARVRRFAADASHELRTPLTSIQGYAELWRAGGLRSEAEVADAMRRMEQEARRMGALVEDLLLLARLDQRRPLDRDEVRLDQIAADGLRDAQAVEPDRPFALLSDRPVEVEGDEMRLRQVVGNLLSNARAHTPAGSLVQVSVTATDGLARLEVVDQGPGLAPEVAARVFERFYRADPSRARAAGGTGLGLAIVAAIAEAHGGRAFVESEPGAGSRFVVELPSRAAAPAPSPPGGDEAPPGQWIVGPEPRPTP